MWDRQHSDAINITGQSEFKGTSIFDLFWSHEAGSAV